MRLSLVKCHWKTHRDQALQVSFLEEPFDIEVEFEDGIEGCLLVYNSLRCVKTGQTQQIGGSFRLPVHYFTGFGDFLKLKIICRPGLMHFFPFFVYKFADDFLLKSSILIVG